MSQEEKVLEKVVHSRIPKVLRLCAPYAANKVTLWSAKLSGPVPPSANGKREAAVPGEVRVVFPKLNSWNESYTSMAS